MVPFGSLLYYGTYYLGYLKRDPNFENYPHVLSPGAFLESEKKVLNSKTVEMMLMITMKLSRFPSSTLLPFFWGFPY